jgi:hypothetical protein
VLVKKYFVFVGDRSQASARHTPNKNSNSLSAAPVSEYLNLVDTNTIPLLVAVKEKEIDGGG